MQIDIYELNVKFPPWHECLDDIQGEWRGDLVAWAFMNGYDEIVAPAVFEAFHKNNEQSCRRDIAEWLMNLYVDQGDQNRWLQHTRELHWSGCKSFLEKYLPVEEAKYLASMGYEDDISVYKRERDSAVSI